MTKVDIFKNPSITLFNKTIVYITGLELSP